MSKSKYLLAYEISKLVSYDTDSILRMAGEKASTLPVSIYRVLNNWLVRVQMGNCPNELAGIIDGEWRDADAPLLGE